MARIRSVKPEFFQHEAIFDAEKKHSLPLRLAFVGLWTQADRRGLFRWRPRELKLNILPWDDCDFSKVLEALRTEGFLVKYEVDGHHFGLIPTFAKHQVFNLREKPAASIPACPMSVAAQYRNGADTLPVPSGSGRDREGKGRDRVGDPEGESRGETDAAARLGDSPPRTAEPEGLEAKKARIARAYRGEAPPKEASGA